MSVHVHQSPSGTLLQVSYDWENDQLIFKSAYTLNSEYRPIGPDLLDFLEPLFYYKGLVNGVPEGEKFLSVVAGEISEQR